MLLGNKLHSGLSPDCRADDELSMDSFRDDGPGKILLKIAWPSYSAPRDFRLPVTQGDTQFMSGKPRAATAEPEGKAVFMHTGPPDPRSFSRCLNENVATYVRRSSCRRLMISR